MDIKLILIILLACCGLLFIILYKNYNRLESPLIIIFTFLSVSITISFIFIISKAYRIYTGLGEIDMDSTGQVGDFIGGTAGTILTAISIILLYKTLQEQRKSFNNSQIESRFFELLKFHRDNVNEIEFNYNESLNNPRLVKGRHFFVTANKQLTYAFEEFNFFVQSKKIKLNDIYELNYLEKLQNNLTLKKRNFLDFFLLSKIDICYLVLFIGVSKSGKEEIIELTKEKYKVIFMEELLEFFRRKPSKSSKYYDLWKKDYRQNSYFENLNTKTEEKKHFENDIKCHLKNELKYPNNYNKFYGGHQFRLGHYFRHLYQIVCFIHNNIELTKVEKKNYIRILRGQLSDYEQKLFFINSLSQLGRIWEISTSSGSTIKNEDHLITNYNIIKSISKATLIDNLKPNQIYPTENNE